MIIAYAVAVLAHAGTATLEPFQLPVVDSAQGRKFLGVVNRVHMRVTGRLSDRRETRSWNKSMRGERRSTTDRGVLEQVMLISVGCALVLFGIWFFAFAGSSLPS